MELTLNVRVEPDRPGEAGVMIVSLVGLVVCIERMSSPSLLRI